MAGTSPGRSARGRPWCGDATRWPAGACAASPRR